MKFIDLLCVLLWAVVADAGRLNFSQGEACKEEGGKKWICRKRQDCPYPLKDLEDESKEPPFCQFEGPEPVVCCDPDIGGGKSRDMCKKYAQSVFTSLPGNDITVDTCVSNSATDSSRGHDASPREYPHMALLGYGNPGDIKWSCGGTLISDLFVLSAAHCSGSGVSGRPKWVRLGDYNIKSNNDDENGQAQSVVYEITEVILHPDYKPSSFYHDIALYKLNTTVKFNAYVRPICLQKGHEYREDSITLTGWGQKEFGGERHEILQESKAKTVPWKICNDFYNTSSERLAEGVKDELMVCAGDAISGSDRCFVLSGDPLQQVLAEPHCMYSLVGTASFHNRCGGPRLGVFSRVSHYVQWIENIVWP